VFTHLRLAPLQIVLTTTISTASYERSFSKLKLFFSYLRASTTVKDSGQIVRSAVVLMRTERHKTVKVDFDDILGEFTSIKPRNVLIYLAKSNLVFFTNMFGHNLKR